MIDDVQITNSHIMVAGSMAVEDEGTKIVVYDYDGNQLFEIRWRRYQFSGQAQFHYRHGGNRKWFCGCRWKYA